MKKANMKNKKYKKYTIEWVLYDKKFNKFMYKDPVKRIITLYTWGQISEGRCAELIHEYYALEWLCKGE